MHMDHELEASILKLQKDGLRLYGALAEFYFWLGYRNMGDILREKFLSLAERNMDTRQRFVEDTGEMIAPKRGQSFSKKEEPRTYRLQWQEGTDEPEDEPNVSNGTDILPKNPPTEQPWEKGFSGSSGPVPTEKDKVRTMYDASLDRWLVYEEDAARLYGEMADKRQEGFWEELRNESQDEIARLRKN